MKTDDEFTVTTSGAKCSVCSQPEPCSCVACPRCGATAPYADLGHVCRACDWREDRCGKCGELMPFAADYRGTTCGGLDIVGARACVPCGIYEVCRKSRPASEVDWRVAKSGRSVDAGSVRIRAERGEPGQVEALMARIARLPDLEMEVERLRVAMAKRSAA